MSELIQKNKENCESPERRLSSTYCSWDSQQSSPSQGFSKVLDMVLWQSLPSPKRPVYVSLPVTCTSPHWLQTRSCKTCLKCFGSSLFICWSWLLLSYIMLYLLYLITSFKLIGVVQCGMVTLVVLFQSFDSRRLRSRLWLYQWPWPRQASASRSQEHWIRHRIGKGRRTMILVILHYIINIYQLIYAKYYFMLLFAALLLLLCFDTETESQNSKSTQASCDLAPSRAVLLVPLCSLGQPSVQSATQTILDTVQI